MELSVKAGLSEAEIITVIQYTGPLVSRFRTVLVFVYVSSMAA
jgi:hypothetical protein